MFSLYKALYFIYKSRESIYIDICVNYIRNIQYKVRKCLYNVIHYIEFYLYKACIYLNNVPMYLYKYSLVVFI